MAGGTPQRGTFGAQYFQTRFGAQGQLGSKVLKPRPTGVAWAAGSTQEVSWQIEANHGGGCERLAPAPAPPLPPPFARNGRHAMPARQL